MMKKIFLVLGLLGFSQGQACENWTDEFMMAVHSNMANALKILQDNPDLSLNPSELLDLSRKIRPILESNSAALEIKELLEKRGTVLSEDMNFNVLFPQTP